MAAFTHKGQALVAELMAAGKRLVIDQVVFANIPDLEVEGDIDRETEKPSADLIVHEAPIYRASFVNESAVVYSAFLNSTVGPFTFNWFGLYCSEHKTLVALEYTAPQKKVKTENGVFGNNLVKNLVIQFNSAQALTGIEIPVESWQLNFADQVNELYARTEQATEETKGIISIASLEEIKKGDSAIKVVTPQALKPVLDEIRNNLKAFENRKDNPHQVSKHQVGLGQVNNFPATSQLTESSNEKIPTCAVTHKLDELKAQRYHTHTLDEVGLPNVQNLPIVHDPVNGRKDQYASGHAVKSNYQLALNAHGIGTIERNTANDAHLLASASMKPITLYSESIHGRLQPIRWRFQTTSTDLAKARFILLVATETAAAGDKVPCRTHTQLLPVDYLKSLNPFGESAMFWTNKSNEYCEISVYFAKDNSLLAVFCSAGRAFLRRVEIIHL